MNRRIRVLVVEDSAVFRTLLVKYLNEDPEIEVMAEAGDPFEARDCIIRYRPDVMTLDIELPRMDGIEFLQKLMPQYPMRTVVITTLSNRVFDALKAGAVDFVAKPKVHSAEELSLFVKAELPQKIKIAASASLKKSYLPVPAVGGHPVASAGINSAPVEKMVIAIGASTGGTEAIDQVIREFGKNLPGTVITQHMPSGFTTMYARRLNQNARPGVEVKEAENGDEIRPGRILLAPGGERQMRVIRGEGRYQVRLTHEGKVNGHCPSVDVLFDSVAEAAGAYGIGVLLTGMGGDGAKGLLKMRQRGAKTIGQDASTCVIYGMPKVAYELGAVEFQEKLSEITKRVYTLVGQSV